ncbi:hypothetical protein AVEN_210677-1 [Araneus ventricosus]|uniref:Uncharacterized protein n=1 Tax=Araneus ventricosus TaxID=182803 RepID=A0A4Y2VQD9_ARAVE|nr:hypothetical protein AVEN_210677-1 [Araneus ventricosus]
MGGEGEPFSGQMAQLSLFVENPSSSTHNADSHQFALATLDFLGSAVKLSGTVSVSVQLCRRQPMWWEIRGIDGFSGLRHDTGIGL